MAEVVQPDLLSTVKSRTIAELNKFLSVDPAAPPTQFKEALIWCCKNSWYEGTSRLLREPKLEQGIKDLIQSKSEDGKTILHWLAIGPRKPDLERQFFELIDQVIALGVDINQRDSKGMTALMKSIDKSHLPFVKSMISRDNIQLDLTDLKRLNAVDHVILSNDDSIAEEIMKHRKEYTTKDGQIAWLKFQSNCIGLLASIFVNLNEEKIELYFMNAIQHGYEKQVTFFLDKKINVSAVDPRHGTHIFFIAAGEGFFSLCKTLMKRTNIIIPKTQWVHSVAWHALRTDPTETKSEADFIKLFKGLIKNKDVNIADHVTGETLLHEACFRGNVTAVKILIKAGATPLAMTARGETPLHYLTRCTKLARHAEIARLVFEPLVGDQRHLVLQARGPEGVLEQVARKYNLVDLLSVINQIRGFKGDDIFWSVLWLLIPRMTRDQIISLTYVNKRLRQVCLHEILWAGRVPEDTSEAEYDVYYNEMPPRARDQMILARYYRQRARGEYFKLLLTRTNYAQFNNKSPEQIGQGMTLAQLSSTQQPSMEYKYLFDEGNNPLLIGFKPSYAKKKPKPANKLSGLLKKMKINNNKDSDKSLKSSQDINKNTSKTDLAAEDDLLNDFEAKGQHIFKVLLLGDIGVGKTSVLLRFIENRFGISAQELETILAGDFVETAWDTIHLEKLRNACKPHRNTDIALIHFDLSSSSSLERIEDWANWVGRDCSSNTRILIVGCKADHPKRKVSAQEAKAKSASLGATYIETSALLDLNCDLVYWLAANQTLQYIHAGVQLNMTTIH